MKHITTGGSFVNSAIDKTIFILQLPGHGFTGSGIKLDKRLNASGTQQILPF